jgi:F0F1-type ATP synthase membrane subunit b/b'
MINMSALLFQGITLIANFLILSFVAYYFLRFRAKEKELDARSGKIDTEYHQVIDNALAHERKILEDATSEATRIISGAQNISDSSKYAVTQALENIAKDIQSQAANIAQGFMGNYQNSLKGLSDQSLLNVQNITKGLETELQTELAKFHEKMLPELEQELENYKQARLKQIEETVTRVIGEVSQEVLNKSINISDHENLVIQSLERAKKEGVFG